MSWCEKCHIVMQKCEDGDAKFWLCKKCGLEVPILEG